MGARRNRRGANALEFGLIMPVFVSLFAGICDLAWQASNQAALESAAHFGCRQGSLVDPGLREVNVAQVVKATSDAMVGWYEDHGSDCGADGCITNVTTVGSTPARSLRCQIGTRFTPLLGLVVTERQLTAEAVVRLEYQRSL